MAFIQTVFFNLTVRLYVLRLTCLAALLALIVLLIWKERPTPVGFIFLSIILAHQFASALFDSESVRLKKIIYYLDPILVTCEFGGLLLYLIFSGVVSIQTWSSQPDILYAAFGGSLVVLLGFGALLRCAPIVRSRFSGTDAGAAERFNILTAYDDNPRLKVLFGESPWKKHFPGESMILRSCRGILALLFILAIIYLSISSIILGPVRQSLLIPVQDVRAMDVPVDFQAETAVWNVIVTRLVYNGTWDDNDFHNAVMVVPLWDNVGEPLPGPPCAHVDGSKNFSSAASSIQARNPQDRPIQAITIHCPPRLPIPDAQKHSILPLADRDARPDLLITIDYTKIGLPLSNVNSTTVNSVEVYISLTNKTEMAISRTLPTTIPPGVNLMGTLSLELRQVYKNARTSAFGLLPNWDTIMIARVINMFPDPNAGIAPDVSPSPKTSTFRVYVQSDPSEWITTSDARDESVLSGLSRVGGLWAFLSGIFTVYFGTSLLRIISGVKPISILGIAHQLQGDDISRECRRAAITHTPPEGLMGFISEYLIDVSFLDEPAVVVPPRAANRPRNMELRPLQGRPEGR